MTSLTFSFKRVLAVILALLPLLAWSQAPVFDRAQVVGAAPTGGGNSAVTALALDAQGNQYVAGFFTGTVSVGSTSLTATGSFPASIYLDSFVGKLDSNGNWLWVARTGGGGAGIYALTTDATGNVYVGGSFSSPQLQLGTRTLNNSSSGGDAFVAKLDAQGNWLWARRAGGTGGEYVTGLAIVGASLYVCGSFESVTADFGPVTLTNNYTIQDGRSDVFLTELEAVTGNWQRALSAGGLQNEQALAMSVDMAGNLYLTGSI